MALEEELIELVRTDPALRGALRREILTGELLDLPSKVGELAAAQLRTEQRLDTLAVRVEELAAAQLRTEQRLDALIARVDALVDRVDALVGAMESMHEELRGLTDWRQGEQGRREGERYERTTVRHAYAIFGGGRDVTRRPEALEYVLQALDAAPDVRAGLTEADDPFLADLLWIKGGKLAVVEISRRIDTSDIKQAGSRAAVLRAAGLPAVGMVIGRDWTSEEAERAAERQGIEWRVAEDASDGYREYRQEPAGKLNSRTDERPHRAGGKERGR